MVGYGRNINKPPINKTSFLGKDQLGKMTGQRNEFDTDENEVYSFAQALGQKRPVSNRTKHTLSCINITMVFITFVSVTAYFITVKNGTFEAHQLMSLISNVSNIIGTGRVATFDCEYHQFPNSSIKFSICEARAEPSCFITFYQNNDILRIFNSFEAAQLLKWLQKCNPKDLQRSRCNLIPTTDKSCWRRSIFGGGTWLCYNHNYEFDSLVINGVRLSFGDSLFVVKTILTSF